MSLINVARGKKKNKSHEKFKNFEIDITKTQNYTAQNPTSPHQTPSPAMFLSIGQCCPQLRSEKFLSALSGSYRTDPDWPEC